MNLSKDLGGYALSNLRFYDAWGAPRGGGHDSDTRYCANLGHRTDDESGLMYMRARYYEPGSGRFISQDPARDGWNWYSYCNNEPILRSDFTGKAWHILIGAVLGGISAGFIASGQGQEGNELLTSIVIGVVTGALTAATGAWITSGIGGTAGLLTGGGVAGGLGSGLSALTDEVRRGGSINWGRIGRQVAIGGVLGIAFGAIGAAAQRNAEIAGWLSGLNGDLIGNATDAYYEALK